MSNESLKAKLDAYNAEYAKQTAKHPERVGLKHKNLYTPLDLEGFDYERDLGRISIHPWRTADHVSWPSLDHAYVCRLRNR